MSYDGGGSGVELKIIVVSLKELSFWEDDNLARAERNGGGEVIIIEGCTTILIDK
ncbi:hypothetical protein [Erwinia sp. 198]|uniref:hypothetical protein n=1 Tax=Erwinia sp. 198 TaxID=2022746 RepID=UPI0013154340|nr:hypothetical protein [Erwinia sp. 198]